MRAERTAKYSGFKVKGCCVEDGKWTESSSAFIDEAFRELDAFDPIHYKLAIIRKINLKR